MTDQTSTIADAMGGDFDRRRYPPINTPTSLRVGLCLRQRSEDNYAPRKDPDVVSLDLV